MAEEYHRMERGEVCERELLQNLLWRRVVGVHRILSALSYPIPILFNVLIYWAPTRRNAQFFLCLCLMIWLPCSGAFYLASCKGLIATTWLGFCVQHFVWFYAVDFPMFICTLAASTVGRMFSRTCTSRLFGETPTFKGDRIIVLGNGPSLVKGAPLGNDIDDMDEVVRFNNFQTKNSGLQEWTGGKTTVHFSDSMLFPSYPEYHAPGATVALSLFMDRLMVAGSYLIFRCGADLAFREAFEMLLNPSLGWIPCEDISNLKKELGISHWKHPTSGCLAIDWFVRNRPNPDVPVYIHGFDFFEGPEIHYYNKTEPLYERINDLIGVTTMHQPEKEKAFVARLVAEGKVKWLKDAKRKMSPSLNGGA
mmetsp:Transcript_120677/g.191386  ORF Transcript_120677/g.191386 Transcript_120677/m.191386 type:complete len:365 (+) Transcript_120677:50-1144(+)